MKTGDKKIIAGIIVFWFLVFSIAYLVIYPPGESAHILTNIVDITKKGEIQWHKVIFKRKGRYHLHVSFYKKDIGEQESNNYPLRSNESNNTTLRMEMECYSNNKLINKFMHSGKVSLFEGIDEWRYTLFVIKVPEELPLKTTLSCKFEVKSPETKYSKIYGVKDVNLWRMTH
ncbi:MAG: hypothetical protein KAR83_00145 [Thermodesulfovibrionales bacterium]|nr:hypothetical protein [Thermodesulfovibrionales bacterium]